MPGISDFVEHLLHALGSFRMLVIEIFGFTEIFLQVVKL